MMSFNVCKKSILLGAFGTVGAIQVSCDVTKDIQGLNINDDVVPPAPPTDDRTHLLEPYRSERITPDSIAEWAHLTGLVDKPEEGLPLASDVLEALKELEGKTMEMIKTIDEENGEGIEHLDDIWKLSPEDAKAYFVAAMQLDLHNKGYPDGVAFEGEDWEHGFVDMIRTCMAKIDDRHSLTFLNADDFAELNKSHVQDDNLELSPQDQEKYAFEQRHSDPDFALEPSPRTRGKLFQASPKPTSSKGPTSTKGSK